MSVGRKIYYENATGNVILHIPEQHHENAQATTKEQDFEIYSVLQARTMDSVGVIEVPYGENRGDFEKAKALHVNIDTLDVEFEFPHFDPPHDQQLEDLQNRTKLTQAELDEMTKTAQEKYNEASADSTTTLDELKNLKLNVLKYECTQAIYAGFVSSVTATDGTFYEFGFKAHDQDNFDQQLGKINLWMNKVNNGTMTQTDYDAKFPLSWKSKSHGVIQLTEDEFITVTDDAEVHKWNQQSNYWDLEAQVITAYNNGDKAGIDSVVW